MSFIGERELSDLIGNSFLRGNSAKVCLPIEASGHDKNGGEWRCDSIGRRARTVVLYRSSTRLYGGLPGLDYPFHDKAVIVTTAAAKINLSTVFAGQTVGIKQTDDHIWLVSFMHYDLGYFDDQTCRLEPLPSLRTKSVTYVSGIIRNPCVQNGPRLDGG